MTARVSSSVLAARFVGEATREWMPPYDPVVVGGVRTTAHGAWGKALARLIDEVRAECDAEAKHAAEVAKG